jgi:hypothetical protein
MAINFDRAMSKLKEAGIDIEADFRSLRPSEVLVLLECAKLDGYNKPLNAYGSTARMYFDALQRLHRRKKKSNKP